MKRLLFRTATVAYAAMSLSGCSSVPDFKPSKPLEEASSFSEALDLCSGYEIKGEQNEAGRAKLARAVVLTPWLRCFETVLRRFAEGRQREDFVAFFRSLQSRHDGSSPSTEVIDWPAMNFAVRHAVERLKDPKLPYTPEGILAIEQQIPGYAMYLNDSGLSTRQFEPKSAPGLRTSPLNPVPKSEIVNVPPPPVPLNGEQKEYCKRYRNYRGLVYNIEELTKYKAVLDGQTYADVSNTGEKSIRDRVNGRLDSMRKESDQQQSELTAELGKLQSSSGWFLNGHCLQSQQGHLRK